ncbi:MAG: hypothetical protein P4N24_10885 [Acidobacteriota bacterium]|jgi:hypothetical protein|nr:hypothetical protein [Acidobacteriota bacterium]
MSTTTEAVRDQLMVGNEEYRRLREEHARYKTQLNELSAKSHLSVEEQAEELRLKKLKLRAKDQMELLVRQAQSVH